MRKYLAFLCGKMFLFWYNLCGSLDGDMAIGVLAEMFFVLLDNDEDMRNKAILKLAPYLRREEFSPGR